MKQFLPGLTAISVAIAAWTVFAPTCAAQYQGSATRIQTTPNNLTFYVDGEAFNQTISPFWPAGSKHVLWVDSGTQGTAQGTQYVFAGWQTPNGALTGNPITVTADPSIPVYTALFTTAGYQLQIHYFSCSDAQSCLASPGSIQINGVTINSDITTYEPIGGPVVLYATPNPGWVFSGWVTPSTIPGQVTPGPQLTFSMTQPMTVSPVFQTARAINLTTVPAGLEVYADRTLLSTPASIEWGQGSTHTLAGVTPQQNAQGWWIFSSWSDGGAFSHAVQVPITPTIPNSYTATYVPGASVNLQTSPVGLHIKVDGKDAAGPYYFLWGEGQTHHLEATASQTDAQGAPWQFTGWSNGVTTAAQDFTVPTGAAATGVLLTATFSPLASLTVTSSIPGLSVSINGAACTTPCNVVRPVGTQVVVSAPASIAIADSTRQDFLGWSNGAAPGDLTLTLTGSPLTVGANYHLMNRLATAAAPPAGASWSLAPSSPDGFYDSQTTVNLKVSALPGYKFRNWTGDLSGPYPAGSLQMNAPHSVMAQLDPAPYIQPAGVMNAAGSTPQTGTAPGSIISIFGVNLASATAVGHNTPLDQTLAGVTVHIGDRVLPLYFVSPTQINLQLPSDVPTGTQTVTVSSQGMPDVQAGFNVVQDAPGLFPQLVNGQSFALVLHEDGSLVSLSSPAQQGELLTLLGTGFGPTSPARLEGFPVPQTPVYQVTDTASIFVGDFAITPENAYAVPGQVGVDAVQFRLGNGAPTSTNGALRLNINGQDSNTLLLPIQ